ncbi:MAG TPA: hypothetical protein DCY35_10850 [Prolixibacteraceae bacterium]|nr:hypothetical protein [Prolixibacteraceae bacterium]
MDTIEIKHLRCEYKANPLGTDMIFPALTWVLCGECFCFQSSYRIVASSTTKKLEEGKYDFWDTGKVKASNSHARYAGESLTSRKRVYWQVKVWDQEERESEFSAPAYFETGLMDPGDWHGIWIGDPETSHAPLFRKALLLDREISTARIYVCGLGYHEITINGEKITDEVLIPNQTDYDAREYRDMLYPYVDRTEKRVVYNTFDVTRFLRTGENVLGIQLGNGFYNQRERVIEGTMWYDTPRVILQSWITFNDGTEMEVFTDESWKTAAGPIVFNNIFYGEVYDARLELPGWDCPGYNASSWRSAAAVRAPRGKLCAQTGPSDRRIRKIPATRIWPHGDQFICDFGENLSGWVRLKAGGAAGTEITLRFGENVNPDGSVNFNSCKQKEQYQKDVFILKGDPEGEVFEPRFVWHGFRYAEITGYPSALSIEDIEAFFICSDVKVTGSFTCSHPLINQIQDNYVRTQLGNMHGSVPSDCPHRERLGYTGDGQIAMEASLYNLDALPFYLKWNRDIQDSQDRMTGWVPHTAPFGGGAGGIGWGSAIVIVPWNLYQFTGNAGILAESYPFMEKWMEYLKQRVSMNGLIRSEIESEIRGYNLGDWSNPGQRMIPPAFTNTYFYIQTLRIMRTVDRILGRGNSIYAEREKKAVNAFNREFLNRDEGCYSIGKQGTEAYALHLGIVPGNMRKRVVERLTEHIIRTCDGHLDTGIFGTPILLDVLVDLGRIDLAEMILMKMDYPGYGNMIKNGATTLWESWGGGSNNHPMLGSVSAWFYKKLAGIQTDPEYPGFARVILRPCLSSSMDHVEAKVETVRGSVHISWCRQEKEVELSIYLPNNMYAWLYLPGGYCLDKRDKSKNMELHPGYHRLYLKKG